MDSQYLRTTTLGSDTSLSFRCADVEQGKLSADGRLWVKNKIVAPKLEALDLQLNTLTCVTTDGSSSLSVATGQIAAKTGVLDLQADAITMHGTSQISIDSPLVITRDLNVNGSVTVDLDTSCQRLFIGTTGSLSKLGVDFPHITAREMLSASNLEVTSQVSLPASIIVPGLNIIDKVSGLPLLTATTQGTQLYGNTQVSNLTISSNLAVASATFDHAAITADLTVGNHVACKSVTAQDNLTIDGIALSVARSGSTPLLDISQIAQLHSDGITLNGGLSYKRVGSDAFVSTNLLPLVLDCMTSLKLPRLGLVLTALGLATTSGTLSLQAGSRAVSWSSSGTLSGPLLIQTGDLAASGTISTSVLTASTRVNSGTLTLEGLSTAWKIGGSVTTGQIACDAVTFGSNSSTGALTLSRATSGAWAVNAQSLDLGGSLQITSDLVQCRPQLRVLNDAVFDQNLQLQGALTSPSLTATSGTIGNLAVQGLTAQNLTTGSLIATSTVRVGDVPISTPMSQNLVIGDLALLTPTVAQFRGIGQFAQGITCSSLSTPLASIDNITTTTSQTTQLKITGTTNSSSITTGSLLCAGGMSVEKNMYVGGTAVFLGDIITSGPTASLQNRTVTINDNVLVVNAGPNGTNDGGFVVQRWQPINDSGLGDVVRSSEIEYSLPSQSGTTNMQIILNSAHIATTYQNWYIYIRSGPCYQQVRRISSYNATSRTATLTTSWTTQNPTLGDRYTLHQAVYTGFLFDESQQTFCTIKTASDPVTSGTVGPYSYAALRTSRLQASAVDATQLIVNGVDVTPRSLDQPTPKTIELAATSTAVTVLDLSMVSFGYTLKMTARVKDTTTTGMYLIDVVNDSGTFKYDQKVVGTDVFTPIIKATGQFAYTSATVITLTYRLETMT